MKEALIHFKEFMSEFQHTGSFCATSQWAAKAMTNPLRNTPGKKNILEIGPGTGSVTVKILRDMHPGDHLTIVEINPRFLAALKEKLADNDDFQRNKEHVSFVEAAVQELPTTEKFDIIVCSLPFLNFDLETIKEIFDKLREVSTENTVMTYYRYIGLRPLGKLISKKERKEDMEVIDQYFAEMHNQQQIDRTRVWLNLLPINIYTLKMSGDHRENNGSGRAQA